MVRLKYSFLFLPFIFIILTSCNSGFYQNQNITVTPSVSSASILTITPSVTFTSTPTIAPSATPTSKSHLSCSDKIIPVYKEHVIEFFWKNDGKDIVFLTKDGDWYNFNLDNQSTEMIDYDENQNSFSETLIESLGIQNPIKIFIPENSDKILYTKRVEDNINIIRMDTTNRNEVTIGSINGVVSDHRWINNDTALIIFVRPGEFGPSPDASLYIIDVESNQIIPIIKHKQFENFYFLDLSPDEKQILFFQYNGERNLKIIDINGTGLKTTTAPFPRVTLWLSDNVFFGAGINENSNILMYEYNLSTNTKTDLSVIQADLEFSYKNSIQISSDYDIAFISDEYFDNNALYLLRCEINH